MLARPKRFELLTPRFVVWCSIQLSYGRVCRHGPKKPGERRIAIGSGGGWQPCLYARARSPRREVFAPLRLAFAGINR